MQDQDYNELETDGIEEGNHTDSDEEIEKEYEDVCYICRRPESKAGKMFHLLNEITICNDCMHTAMDSLNQYDTQAFLSNMPGMGNQSPETRTEHTKQENKTKDDVAVEDIETNDNKDNNEIPVLQGTPGQIGELFDELQKKFPGISFLNMSDIPTQSTIGKKQKLKKKKADAEHTPIVDIKKIPAPHALKGMLDDYIIGQEHAKKVISVAVYNHYKRVATDTMDEIEIEKSNMLMIGPTGCGKTYLVKTLARLLDVPLAITDATSLTEAGYIGDDIESVVSKLLAAADNDVERAESGIIFIDEIDKIAKKQNTSSRDVSGESVQQGMLKLLEGSDVEVPVGANSKNAMVPLTTINTRNILFICGGAFPDLEEIIKQRLNKKTSIGYQSNLKDKHDKDKNILQKVETEDLKKFGMIPEFIGRLPITYTLDALTKELLIQILREPKNAILKQYQKLLELDEVKLEFDESALEAIADKALEKDTGARALRAIIEKFMLDIMYEIPKDANIGRVTITGDYINGTGGPIIDIRSNNMTLTELDELQEVGDDYTDI
ncbi:MAG: ATP-dependent Clp protease ATP-binding subunit ClpX [Eubacteriales bacterium]